MFAVGRGVSNTLGLVLNVVLSRVLGAGLYGVYTYVNVLLSLFAILTQLGSDKSVVRFIPEYEGQPRKRHVVTVLAYGTCFLAGVVVSCGVYLSAPFISSITLNSQVFTNVLRITAIIIPFNSAANVTAAMFKSIERMDYSVAVTSIAQPALRLVFVGGAVVLGFSIVGAAAGLVVSGLLGFLFAVWVITTRTDLLSAAHPTGKEIAEYYDFSVPLTLNQIGSFAYRRTDILMVGFLLSGGAVGVYNAAFLVSQVLSLPLSGVNQLFPAVASRLYQTNQIEELESVYSSITRIVLTLSVFPAGVVLVYSGELLSVFGQTFTEGSVVLQLFVVSQLANVLVGPSGYLLMMTDHQYLTMLNQVGSGIVNAVLNYVLLVNLGLVLPAVSTATVISCVNLLSRGQLWYYERFNPYDSTFLKPVFSGVVAAGTMYAVSMFIDGLLLLVAGSMVGVILFAGSVYYLGLEPTDIRVAKQMLGQER